MAPLTPPHEAGLAGPAAGISEAPAGADAPEIYPSQKALATQKDQKIGHGYPSPIPHPGLSHTTGGFWQYPDRVSEYHTKVAGMPFDACVSCGQLISLVLVMRCDEAPASRGIPT